MSRLPPRNCGTCIHAHDHRIDRFSVKCLKEIIGWIDGKAIYRWFDVTEYRDCHSFPVNPDTGEEISDAGIRAWFKQWQDEYADRYRWERYLAALPWKMRDAAERRKREDDAIAMHLARQKSHGRVIEI